MSATTVNPNGGLPADLQTALNAYKTNYAAFKVSGNTSYQTAYQNALNAVNNAIANMQGATQSNDVYIQNFISSYQQTNRDIVALQEKSRAIQRDGPVLQDKLAQTQQLHTRVIAEADETSLYVKGAVVVGLLIAVGIIGAL
jgi:CHASE3 domain sensor protein